MYPDVLLVGKFEGYAWINLVSKSENLPYSGTDFALIQNNGYLIITNKDIKITLDGWKDRDAQYSEIKEGWNLVGGSLYTSNSSASRLIENLNQKGINIESVAKWNLDTGHFDYRVEKDEDYGEDFRLVSNEALFISYK